MLDIICRTLKSDGPKYIVSAWRPRTVADFDQTHQNELHRFAQEGFRRSAGPSSARYWRRVQNPLHGGGHAIELLLTLYCVMLERPERNGWFRSLMSGTAVGAVVYIPLFPPPGIISVFEGVLVSLLPACLAASLTEVLRLAIGRSATCGVA